MVESNHGSKEFTCFVVGVDKKSYFPNSIAFLTLTIHNGIH